MAEDKNKDVAASASKPKEEGSPVAAREQLEARSNPGGNPDQLEQKAKEQEAQQKKELSQTLTGPGYDEAAKLQEEASEVPAAARAGHKGSAATQGGFMDQMSVRSGADAMEGHFVTIDKDFEGVKEAYEAKGLEDHTGFYGVYLEPVALQPDTGIPVAGLVRLRDDTHATVVVPYDAMSPAVAGGR